MPKISRVLFVSRRETRTNKKGENLSYLFLSIFIGYGTHGHDAMQIYEIMKKSRNFPCMKTPFFSGMGSMKIEMKAKGNLFG